MKSIDYKADSLSGFLTIVMRFSIVSNPAFELQKESSMVDTVIDSDVNDTENDESTKVVALPLNEKIAAADVKQLTPKKSVHKPVRKKEKKMTEVNKSEEIRKVAAELKVKGETVRPKSIIDILKKRGIKVVPPQVSIVLKNAGYRPAGKSRKRAPKAVKPADSGKVSAPAGKSGSVNIDELLVAKKFAVGFGGVEKAIAALNALNRLS
jgi:transposase